MNGKAAKALRRAATVTAKLWPTTYIVKLGKWKWVQVGNMRLFPVPEWELQQMKRVVLTEGCWRSEYQELKRQFHAVRRACVR